MSRLLRSNVADDDRLRMVPHSQLVENSSNFPMLLSGMMKAIDRTRESRKSVRHTTRHNRGAVHEVNRLLDRHWSPPNLAVEKLGSTDLTVQTSECKRSEDKRANIFIAF